MRCTWVLAFLLCDCFLTFPKVGQPQARIDYLQNFNRKTEVLPLEKVKLIFDGRPWDEEEWDPKTKTLYLSWLRISAR